MSSVSQIGTFFSKNISKSVLEVETRRSILNEEEQLMLVEANLNFDEFLIQVCEREVSLLDRSQILYKKFDDIFTLHKEKPWLNESSHQCYVCEKKIGLQKTHWYCFSLNSADFVDSPLTRPVLPSRDHSHETRHREAECVRSATPSSS